MKKDFKLILFPILAVLIFGGIIFFMNKSKEETKDVQPVATAPSQLMRDSAYVKGDANAPVTIVEFFDPECEGCGAFHPLLKRIMDEYEGKVKLVARYMLFHGNSLHAAFALEGAGAQGKYYDLFNILLERQNEWGHQEPGSVNHIFEKYAKEIGLNVETFKTAFNNPEYAAIFEKDIADGKSLGVRGTPTFFINGKMLQRLSYQDLRNAIDAELK